MSAINAGAVHAAALPLLGDSLLYGLEKPDKSTRPIGVGAALRRLAGRCVYAQLKERFGEVFTTTKPSAEQLRAAGFAPDAPCFAPLQLGCGVAGGAEIAVAAIRLLMELKPEWAVLSDDKRNGYNALWREAIFRGVRRWFPELLPTVRLFYARDGGLYTRERPCTAAVAEGADGDGGAAARLPSRGHGPRPAVDEEGECYGSREGCTQGDPLGPVLWSLAYHVALLEIQASHPDTLILAYLDDTYYLNKPAEALAAMRTGDTVTTLLLHVASNTGKQEVYSPAADLAGMPATLRGSPAAPPDEAHGYAGGRLSSIKVLGAFVGESAECSRRLVERVEKSLKPLRLMVRMRDTSDVKVAMQVQLAINRYCANTQLTYFLRAMPLTDTCDAQRKHDQLIWEAANAIIGTQGATRGERDRARAQLRLPVRMGGMGVTSMVEVAPAARLGTWALCWRPLQRLCPALFGDVDIAKSSAASLKELRTVHASLLESWRRTKGIYDSWDKIIFDYDKEGESHHRFHPSHLPARHELVSVAEFASSPTI